MKEIPGSVVESNATRFISMKSEGRGVLCPVRVNVDTFNIWRIRTSLRIAASASRMNDGMAAVKSSRSNHPAMSDFSVA